MRTPRDAAPTSRGKSARREARGEGLRAGGLRALAALAEPMPPEGPGEAAPQPPDGGTGSFPDGGIGPLTAEAADPADLAARLDRLLRREARRHGIEVDEP